MPTTRRPTLRPWLMALLLGAAVVVVRTLAQPLTGDELPFALAYPALVLAALRWGTGPGLLTAAVCAAGAATRIVPSSLVGPERPLQIGVFLIAAILMVLLCGQLRHQRPADAAVDAPAVHADTPLTTWLRTVLWGAFLVPLTAFVIIAWWGYEQARTDAVQSAARARDLAHAHALRTFEVAEQIARRADSASAGPAEFTQANQPAIHQRLADMTAGLVSVVNLNVWDATGHAVASSQIFPVDPRANNADRPYFQDQKRGPPDGVALSDVIKGRQLGEPLMNVTVRRHTVDGSFDGIVAVGLSPRYFQQYYQALAQENRKLASFSLIRIDGRILARFPASPDQRTQVPPGSLVLQRVLAGDTSGDLFLPESPDREARLTSFMRVGKYPVYVMAGLSHREMLADWARFVTVLALVLLPIAGGLVYVSWVALKRTRREQATARELQTQIRRRAAAEKSMMESQKLETLGVVTGGVAHDFNNLLAVVSASLHVHKRRHPELAGDKHLDAVSRAVQSGVRLTRQLLSFSRKQALRPEVLRLQDWIPATEDLIRSTLGPNIRWTCSVQPDTRPVRVDVGELELALLNLVVNARHAMPQGGELTVVVADANDPSGASMVGIAVSDTGVGIPPDALPRVFEAFFTTRARGVGSGLGLSQVQGFCAQAGGHASIDSAVGRGTTVHMTLPAAQEDVVRLAAPDAASPLRLHGTVLLVEDNEDVGHTTELVLRSAGLEVLRAMNADAALAQLRAAPRLPDAVLSDIAMPGTMNGIALAFALRKSHPKLPVLLTTGYAEQVQEAAAEGLRVLPKPVSPEELLIELKGVLRDASESRTVEAT